MNRRWLLLGFFGFACLWATAVPVAAEGLTPADDVALTAALETLSAGPSGEAFNTAAAIVTNPAYTWNDLRLFFNKYFNTQAHPFTDPLLTSFLYAATFWWNDTTRLKMQPALTDPLFDKVNTMLVAHPVNLGPDMAADANLFQSLFNCLRMLTDMGGLYGRIDDATRRAMFNRYPTFINSFPQYFRSGFIDPTAQPYVAALRAQLWMGFCDILSSLTAVDKTTIATTIALSGRHLDIWNRFGVLVHDNLLFSQAQKDVIFNLLDAMPAQLYTLGHITQNVLIGNPYNLPTVRTISSKASINIFSAPVGVGSENSFPNDIAPATIDSFSIGLVHEMNHRVDVGAVSGNPTKSARRDALIAQAGPTALQYLRSQTAASECNPNNPNPNTSFFQECPQEFIASIANEWFTDSKHTLDLGLQRFNFGYKEPLNQVLFFVELYSLGGSTSKFYRIDNTAALSVQDIPVVRDANGRIIGLTYQGIEYAFTLDALGNVTNYSVVNVNLPPQFDDTALKNQVVAAGKMVVVNVRALDHNASDRPSLRYTAAPLPAGSIFVPLGDANLDGVVNSSDSSRMSLYLSNSPAPTLLEWAASDINRDGKITQTDLDQLQAVLAGTRQVSYVFAWVPTNAQGARDYPMTFTVTDAGGLADSAMITITVLGQNLLSNGSFEEGQTDWTGWGPNKFLTTAYAYAGTTSVQINVPATGVRDLDHAVIPVTGGTSYQVRAAIKALYMNSGSAYVQVQWRTSGGALIRIDTFGQTTGTTSWMWRSSGLLTAPSNAAKARISLVVSGGSGRAAYFDDARLEQAY